MATSSKTVLVTAGNGDQARAVIPQPAKAGYRVRTMRRVDRPGPGPKDLGAAEVIIGDACNADDAFKAMEVSTRFITSAPRSLPKSARWVST